MSDDLFREVDEEVRQDRYIKIWKRYGIYVSALVVTIILITVGWCCVGMAFIGIFVPGIPTTIFLIVALWAFARSSKKFHSWLLNHKRFGPILQNWESHKVVPRNAKILMVILQISAVIIFHYSLQNIYLTVLLIITLIFVARYVLSLPSELPVNGK